MRRLELADPPEVLLGLIEIAEVPPQHHRDLQQHAEVVAVAARLERRLIRRDDARSSRPRPPPRRSRSRSARGCAGSSASTRLIARSARGALPSCSRATSDERDQRRDLLLDASPHARRAPRAARRDPASARRGAAAARDGTPPCYSSGRPRAPCAGTPPPRAPRARTARIARPPTRRAPVASAAIGRVARLLHDTSPRTSSSSPPRRSSSLERLGRHRVAACAARAPARTPRAPPHVEQLAVEHHALLEQQIRLAIRHRASPRARHRAARRPHRAARVPQRLARSSEPRRPLIGGAPRAAASASSALASSGSCSRTARREDRSAMVLPVARAQRAHGAAMLRPPPIAQRRRSNDSAVVTRVLESQAISYRRTRDPRRVARVGARTGAWLFELAGMAGSSPLA